MIIYEPRRCHLGSTSLVSVYEPRIRGLSRNKPRYEARQSTSAVQVAGVGLLS